MQLRAWPVSSGAEVAARKSDQSAHTFLNGLQFTLTGLPDVSSSRLPIESCQSAHGPAAVVRWRATEALTGQRYRPGNSTRPDFDINGVEGWGEGGNKDLHLSP